VILHAQNLLCRQGAVVDAHIVNGAIPTPLIRGAVLLFNIELLYPSHPVTLDLGLKTPFFAHRIQCTMRMTVHIFQTTCVENQAYCGGSILA